MRRKTIIVPLLGFAAICLILNVQALVRPTSPARTDDPPDPPLPLQPGAGARPVLRWAGPLPGKYSGYEPAVAADPSGRVVVAAMDHAAGNGIPHLLRWRSENGGESWAAPEWFSPWPPGHDAGFDPWLQTDGRNRFYLASIASGRKPTPGMLAVFRASTDGGKTWGSEVKLADRADRTVLAVSPGGTHLAVACNTDDGKVAFRVPALFRSADQGRTWESVPTPAELRTPFASGGWVAEVKKLGLRTRIEGPIVMPGGLVVRGKDRLAVSWMVWADKPGHCTGVVTATADAGATWTTTALPVFPTDIERDPLRVGCGPALACDRDGVLHVAFVAGKPGKPGKSDYDIYVRSSRDWKTWSEPIRLSSEAAASSKFPVVSAGNKAVHVAWMERREGGNQIWYRGSIDGGKRWSEPLLVSRPNPKSRLVTAAGFEDPAGDYMSLADNGSGAAHIAWGVSGKGPSREVWHALVEWR